MSVICAGAALWDVIAVAPKPAPRGADQAGSVIRRPGGVACNIALALRCELVAVIGNDPDGQALSAAIGLPGLIVANGATDNYIAVEDPSGLVAAIASCDLLEREAHRVIDRIAGEHTPVILDGNLPGAALARLTANMPADLRLVPASPSKTARLHPLIAAGAALYCNQIEGQAMTGHADPADAARALCAQGAAFAIVTDGPRPASFCRDSTVLTQMPPPAQGQITGAGDAFVAGHVRASLSGASDADALSAALQSAADHINGISS
ncbi:PfkB family carbohydrate kinase [Pontivivens insulae]|uniref:Carbohydrate kinase PfkB domain-containing protein n=1 Tax=Pontivivens insulae TaxID=1639689 RepID=A0A2R8AAN7_9RHOB|nr:PfkB family carbohydrate kinase [Pontivivens insulae]RED13200.1 sugar/nucleoside kinase (ribokinase family) [Pontivivens insulae]SPF29292.1 hypothetical protein POI8812_01600 [Pontivivens insulae]